jgi:hypothetical protein
MNSWSWTDEVTTSTITTPLTVTETGVNVEGAFTVNGQPVGGGSGSSYDQDLNTTDDVVFNSALVGDVSIVANTIAGVDSYGNPDTLVVDGNLNVSFENVTSVQGVVSLTNVVNKFYNGSYIEISTTNSFTQQEVDYFKNMSPTGRINLMSVTNTNWGSFPGNSYIDASGIEIVSPTTVRVYVSGFFINGWGNITGQQTYFDAVEWSFATLITTTTSSTPLSVTESGVNVDGNLTVTGDLHLPSAGATPNNTSSVVTWAKVVIGGQTYFTPLYQ